MSNNYTEFCDVLTGITKDEAAWVYALFQALEPDAHDAPDQLPEHVALRKQILGEELGELSGDGEGGMSFFLHMEVEDNGAAQITIADDGGCSDPYAAGRVVQEFLRKFRAHKARVMIAHWDCFARLPACGLNPLFCSNWQSDIRLVECPDCREAHDAAVVIAEVRGVMSSAPHWSRGIHVAHNFIAQMAREHLL